MHRRYFLTFISLTLFCVTRGFGQCETSRFLNYLSAFNHLAITENGVMVMASEYSPFLRSEDNGKTWQKVNVGDYGYFHRLFFTSALIGYTYTQDVLLKTEDAGKTWFPLLTPMQPPPSLWDDFSGGFFINDNKGFMVNRRGRRLYSTIDGGRSFKDTVFDLSIKSIHFADSLNGLLYTDDSVYYSSSDGGRSWVPKKIQMTQEVAIGDMKMVSNNTFFALLRNGQVIRTTNGGNTWRVVLRNLSNYLNSDEIFILNSSEIFVTSGNKVMRSMNGGNNWANLENLPEITMRGIGVSPDKKKLTIAGGSSFAFSQFMAISEDKGNSWDTLSYIDVGSVAMDFPNAQIGYLLSTSHWLFKTNNGGTTWQKIGNGMPFGINGGSDNKKIQFLNGKIAYGFSGQLFSSTDSGKNWSPTNLPENFYEDEFLNFQFVNDSVGFLADRNGIYRTNNRGQSWKKVLSTQTHLMNFYVNPENGIGLAVELGGFVHRTQNIGLSWQPVTFNANALLVSAFVLNDSTAFMGSLGKILYRSSNGGLNWESRLLDNFNTVGLSDFLFSGNDSGIVVSDGRSGALSRAFLTTDGGYSWKLIEGLGGSFKGIGGSVDDPKYLNSNSGYTYKQIPQTMGKLGYINGRVKTCVGEKVVYKVHPVDRATGYMWNATGNPISNVSGFTDTLIWQTPGLYQVTANAFDDCTLSNSQTIFVEVVIDEPKIEKVSDTLLRAVSGESFQWYWNNIPLTQTLGSTSQTFKIEMSGPYKASVTNENGCTNFSNEVYMILPTYHCPGKVLVLNGMVSSGTQIQWQMDSGNGYQDITNSTQFQGANSGFLRISPVGTEFSGRAFRCRYKDYTGVIQYGGETKIVFANRWNGSQNNNWENPLNWSCGSVPDENTEVSILSGTIQIQSNVSIKKLFVAPGATVNVLPGFTLEIKG